MMFEKEIFEEYERGELVRVTRCENCEFRGDECKLFVRHNEPCYNCTATGGVVAASHYCGYGIRRKEQNKDAAEKED